MTTKELHDLALCDSVNTLTELLGLMTPDLEALDEVIKVHKELDPADEPLILSMSLLRDMDYGIWGTEYAL
tara:strand:- start:1188 stop:1400 length:213 start_codon:yes stop_codon:yes gene_type:complete